MQAKLGALTIWPSHPQDSVEERLSVEVVERLEADEGGVLEGRSGLNESLLRSARAPRRKRLAGDGTWRVISVTLVVLNEINNLKFDI
ncbi:hypothetical protein EVAR_82614_1 [Eumeta japonica]|uniref:Uncharacterized protein n=1 Tax=Eumeta variegata TaxID=151549 RepID=A0A4C1X2M7_EUMVA|nr:hypothetical protein EVAR_82614_1 [Eumeta japonica]